MTAAVACFNLATLISFTTGAEDESRRNFKRSCELGFPTACIQQAIRLHRTDPDGARKVAAPNIEPARDHCRDEKQGDCCLTLADWYQVRSEDEEAQTFRALGEDFLGRDCKAGDKGSCRLLKLYRESTRPKAPPKP